MDNEEAQDPSVEGIGMVFFGIASSVALTLDDEDIERFRTAYQGFLDGAHADEGIDPEVLEVADMLTELFDANLQLSLDDPGSQARRKNLREELQASSREELLEAE